ncbi:MAG TPA: hypothetical protein VK206_06755 [Anaerolineales bacterium]|nr:hypothetical protein [Anaerolineales bacterium]
MQSILDIKQISDGIVGLADIIGRLGESIERAIRSGIRSTDIVRRTRERKRLQNFMLLTAYLYREQLNFVSMLKVFCEDDNDSPTAWESAKFEILTILRLLKKIEKYILPYNDALVVKKRKDYLELLTALDERRRFLNFVCRMEYEEALENLRELKKIARAYEKLMNRLKSMSLNFGDIANEDESLWYEVTSAKHFQTLDPKPKSKQSKKQ